MASLFYLLTRRLMQRRAVHPAGRVAEMKGPAMMVLAGLPLLLAGCGGAGSSSAAQSSTGASAAAGTGGPAYSADQLRQALLLQVSGYHPAGPADAGEYGSMRAIQNFNQLQNQIKLDKPQCAGASQAFSMSPEVRTAPAAVMTFAKDNGQTLSETLISVSAGTATAQVKQRVPAGCRNFRVQVGGQWVNDQVTEAPGTRIGDGSRTVGVVTTSGTARVRTWYVVLHSRSYLATVMLHGAAVTKDQVEGFARQAYEQAERILP